LTGRPALRLGPTTCSGEAATQFGPAAWGKKQHVPRTSSLPQMGKAARFFNLLDWRRRRRPGAAIRLCAQGVMMIGASG